MIAKAIKFLEERHYTVLPYNTADVSVGNIPLPLMLSHSELSDFESTNGLPTYRYTFEWKSDDERGSYNIPYQMNEPTLAGGTKLEKIESSNHISFGNYSCNDEACIMLYRMLADNALLSEQETMTATRTWAKTANNPGQLGRLRQIMPEVRDKHPGALEDNIEFEEACDKTLLQLNVRVKLSAECVRERLEAAYDYDDDEEGEQLPSDFAQECVMGSISSATLTITTERGLLTNALRP